MHLDSGLHPVALAVCLLLGLGLAAPARPCSTFMLSREGALVYGHNLNENGIDVPGMVFVNKRGVLKRGRTWHEMTSRGGDGPSSLVWISRHGSVTFNFFGRDLPDGGMNDAGLYIWEMSDRADYPKDPSMPRLMHMNWMQFVLDSYETIDDVIRSAGSTQIDGWAWHYFVADRRGESASIEFHDGEVVVHRDAGMPVPALFNEPYSREMEVLRFFEGFGGTYPVDLASPDTPRVAKAAKLLGEDPAGRDPVDYAFTILDTLKVAETPKWSVVFDVSGQRVYFKTRLNPAVKSFDLSALDFSNRSPVQMLDIDIPEGGSVDARLHPYSDAEMLAFLLALPLPDGFVTGGGLTRQEFCDRAATHWHAAERPETHGFAGRWVEAPAPSDRKKGGAWSIELTADGNRVSGTITREGSSIQRVPLDHLRMIGPELHFTFRRGGTGAIFEVRGTIGGDRLDARLLGMEDDFGSITFRRE